MQIHVCGDASLVSLIDCARYPSYVSRDWDEDRRLVKHLIAQANQRCILSWGTGFETDWRFEVRQGITADAGFREFTGYIACTDGALYLANFDSLTMAAQFEDNALPDEETANYKIELANGLYQVRVVQLVDPSTEWWDVLGEDKPAFLLELAPFAGDPPTVETLPWVQHL